ncbi:MAG: hypothetical protein DRN20_03570 [Thermoplasmata archaeon]|nr:MAG: hypothetical protein DRN20_03570 [Thermoplasmata archaeon]
MMQELMRKFRRGDLPTLKVYRPAETTMVLVHQQGNSKFFRGLDNEWRAIVNTDKMSEALKILQDELQSIKEIESETQNILSDTQRSRKLRQLDRRL